MHGAKGMGLGGRGMGHGARRKTHENEYVEPHSLAFLPKSKGCK